MIQRALLLVTVTAALAGPAAAQTAHRDHVAAPDVDAPRLDLAPSLATRSFVAPPRVTVVPTPPTDPAIDVLTGLEDELRTYRRQRTLGGGVVAAGAAAFAAALFDWGSRDAFGMSTGAAAAFMAGTGLVFLGAELHRVATQRIARAEARLDGIRDTGSGNR